MSLIFDIFHALILLMIITAGFFAVRFKDLLSAVISLGIMSLILSLEFYILQAPDVAIAEAGIGACLTVAVFMIAIRKTTRMEETE